MLALLILPGFFWLPARCDGQNRIPQPEYDYRTLAITSISDSAAAASKLPEIPQRVKLLIYAARILSASRHDEAVSLLDVALRDLKEWGSDDKATWRQRHSAATLRNEVLAVYAVLDAEKTTALQKEFQGASESTASNDDATSLKTDAWVTQFSNRRTTADQAAKIALSLVDTDQEKALGLVVQSLQGGMVSRFLLDIVQKLIQSGNRASLNYLEMGIGQALAANVTLHWSSLTYAGLIVRLDKDMPLLARSAFVSFLMRSLEAWSNIVRGPSGNGGIDTSYIEVVFTSFSLDVRPVILQCSPEQLALFDLVLDQVAPLVPERTKSRLEAFQPEKFSDAQDRLNDILKDPVSERRDLRLVRLISELLGNESENSQKRFDVASDAISGFSDSDFKSAYTDLLTITRINGLVKTRKFIEAQRLANSISSEETRAWALLAVSSSAAKTDRALGFELISNALKALETASPSPHKVELALIATSMLANNDPQRAFDTLTAVSRYANSSASKVEVPDKPPVAFGLDASIGDAHTKLGVFPGSLGEIEPNHSLAVLGVTDWFMSQQIANEIHEPAVRLRLKLLFAEGVLAGSPKLKTKAVSKPSANQ